MTTGIHEWWGLRIRIPDDFEPEPSRLSERVALGLLLGSLVEIIWLAALLMPGGLAASVRNVFLVPLGLTLVPALLLAFSPRILLDLIGAGPMLALSRESGRLKRWDLYSATVSVFLAVGAARLLVEPIRPTLVILLVDIGGASLCLALLQPRLDFTTRRWKPTFPKWLWGEGSTEGVIGPDPGASPVYNVAIPDGSSLPIGIVIPDDVLVSLRKANRGTGGTLYQSDAPAVVLMNHPPAEGVGRNDLRRLCLQLASIAEARSLTPYASANMVLGFVQDAIRYEFDEVSTKDFEGGPFKEYGRFPLETVHDSVGDCECSAILCASLLAHLGIETALIFVVIEDPVDGTTHHAAVGLAADVGLLTGEAAAAGFETIAATDGSGRPYLYGETAVDGMRIAFGDVPSGWKAFMKVEAVVPIPTFQGGAAAN
jgi:hypothetical protein